jgi:hypothetical protein
MVDARLTELTKLDGRVAGATRITDAHRSSLTTIISSARAGLTDLKAQIASDTTAASLKPDCTSVVVDYRVFALRAPQVNLVIGSDAESAVITKIEGLEPRLSDAIAKAAAKGIDVTAAQAAFADLQAKVADASGKVTGLGDTVIAYTPADYNADHTLLDAPRTAVKDARADLKAARDDAKTIATTLRSSTTSTTAAP